MKHILRTIQGKADQMSPTYQQLARYILAHSASVAEMDISTLAAAAGVSTATVTRFAGSLGCSGYLELRQQLKKVIFNNYTSLDEIHGVLSRDAAHPITDVEDALRGLPGRFQLIDKGLIRRAAEMICGSRRTLIVGNQISAMFVPYTQYLLGKYRDNVMNVSDMSFETDKQLSACGAEDCALVFALQRHPNATIKAIHRLHACRVPMIIISDSDLFPFEDLAEVMIHVSFKNSLAFAPVMLVYSVIYDIILNAVALDPGTAEENVRKFDEYVALNHIYYEKGR